MANCANCVHIKVCQKTRVLNPANNLAEDCTEYKDISLFVELPCRIGDSYFEIEQYCTERGYYTEPRHTDTVDCEYCDVDGVCDRQYRITEKRFVSLIQIFEYKEKAADKYNRKFLTKEEAEQALAEKKRGI